jgi:raffinose/stachyose/melibiose transport system substrate-binding protein
VTLTWWNNGNTQPLLGVWQSVAAAFHASHPNVTISVNPIQSDLFVTKMPIALKSDNPPDVFQQWGGGQEATQFTSGKLANLSSLTSSWISELGPAAAGWQVNGEQYGIPYDQHVVGFWYRKDLFAKAGITSPPTTIAQLESDDAKLKAAGITPIALGGGSPIDTAKAMSVLAANGGRMRDYKVLAERLMAEADAALYRAKSAGRNRIATSPNVVA